MSLRAEPPVLVWDTSIFSKCIFLFCIYNLKPKSCCREASFSAVVKLVSADLYYSSRLNKTSREGGRHSNGTLMTGDKSERNGGFFVVNFLLITFDIVPSAFYILYIHFPDIQNIQILHTGEKKSTIKHEIKWIGVSWSLPTSLLQSPSSPGGWYRTT